MIEDEKPKERKPFHRTPSQKIEDEVRNKPLHENIAWDMHKRGEIK